MTTQQIMLAIVATIAIGMMPSVLADQFDIQADIQADIDKMNGVISGIQTANSLMEDDIEAADTRSNDMLTSITAYDVKITSKLDRIASIQLELDVLVAILDDIYQELTREQTKNYRIYEEQIAVHQTDIDFVQDIIDRYLIDITSADEFITSLTTQIETNAATIATLVAQVEHLEALLDE